MKKKFICTLIAFSAVLTGCGNTAELSADQAKVPLVQAQPTVKPGEAAALTDSSESVSELSLDMEAEEIVREKGFVKETRELGNDEKERLVSSFNELMDSDGVMIKTSEMEMAFNQDASITYGAVYGNDNSLVYSMYTDDAGSYLKVSEGEGVEFYSKNYRLNDMPVPRNVLEEYGKVIRLDMKGFDECKSILRRHMFELQSTECLRLFNCARYERLIYNCSNRAMITESLARYYLYDYFSSRAENNVYPDELRETVQGWEIVIGRQYFTAGIEMIWKHILSILNSPSTFVEWSNQAVKEQTILNLDSLVRDLLPECFFD